MTDLIDELHLICDELDQNNIEYALCGGLAVAIYGYVRFTKDIDILIQREDLEQSKEVLAKIGFDLNSGIIPFKTNKGSKTEILRLSKIENKDHLILDILIVDQHYKSIWEQREKITIDKKELCIVSKSALIEMKQASKRPQDLTDIHQLKELDE